MDYDANEIAERPWGAWKVVHQEAAGTVKVLTVNPGCMLSLQTHSNRSELWLPLAKGLIAYSYVPTNARLPRPTNENAALLEPGQTFLVQCGWAHRLVNPTAGHISLVEIITGVYDEEDIVRIHDSYGRE